MTRTTPPEYLGLPTQDRSPLRDDPAPSAGRPPVLVDGGIASLPLFLDRDAASLAPEATSSSTGAAVPGTLAASRRIPASGATGPVNGEPSTRRRARRDRGTAVPTPAGPAEVDWDVVQRLRGAVSTLLTQALHSDPTMDEERQRASAQAHIAEVIRGHVSDQIAIGGPEAAWSPETRTAVARAVFDALFKLGRLQPLVDDPTVENIDIFGYDNVWVSRADGTRQRLGPIARSDAELIADIAFLAQRSGEAGRSFTPSTPILDMDLPGNARLAAVHPPISPRPKIVVRIHRYVDIDLDELVTVHSSLTGDAAAFLDAAVRAGVSIVVAGAPGAGKTTLVRALANCIPPHEEIVTIEKERELHLDRMRDRHHIVTALQYRPGQAEGDGRSAGEVTLIDLLEESLRLNAERIIVGEVRGDEVDAMFQAMQAGVGSLSTIHAHSPTDTIERLAGLTLKSLGTTDAYAYRQIARHIGLIVQVRRYRDPQGTVHRVVTHIAEVQPGEEGRDGVARPIAADIFARRTAESALLPVALPRTSLLDTLEEHGFDQRLLRGDRGGGA